MKTNNILNCQFHKWYPLFKGVTFKTKLYKLPQEFIDYLREDGIVIHDDYLDKSSDSSFSDNDVPKKKDNNEEEHKATEDPDNEDSVTQKKFPELEKEIAKVVEDYEYFFTKLNWSSPKDADGWVPDMKFRTMRDLIYALKVSSFIQHDLNAWADGCVDKEKAQENPIEYHLAMRKWYPMNFSMEFRCFVKNNVLVGISQRHVDVFYKFLLENKESIIQNISSFFENSIKGKFFDETFVFDVYIDKPPKERVWVMDFNPWGDKTDPLLFEWEELEKMETDKGITYKVIEKSNQTREGGLSQFKVPIEFLGDLDNGVKFEDIINNKHPELFQ